MRLFSLGVKDIGRGGLALGNASPVERGELDCCRQLRSIDARQTRMLLRACIDGHLGHVSAFDVRRFSDPGRTRERVNHLGFSGAVQQQIVRDPRFHRWASETVLQLVNRAEQTPVDGTMSIAFWCNSGRHRSVALATLFAQVITASVPAWRVDVLEHLCRCA